MHLHRAAFNRLLNHLGQQVAWQRATACPCRAPRSHAAAPSCPVCHGLGYRWDDPVSCTLAVSGQKVTAEWAKFGLWQSGDQVVSLPSDSPAYDMGQFDRVTMAQSSIPFSVVLAPGERLSLPVVTTTSASWIVDGDLVLTLSPPLVDGRPVCTDPAPPPGASITIRGRASPAYYALQDFPQDRAHQHGRALPRRVVLRRFDLFGRRA